MVTCPDKTSPLVELLHIKYATTYRDYFEHRNLRTNRYQRSTWTEWIELKKGQNYYLETKYYEAGGNL